jgi:gliding motility-associated-like protein
MNNGTPCDPTDDYYKLEAYMFLVGHAGQYKVEVDGVEYGPFSYTHTLEYINDFPADGSILCVKFYDIDDPNCTGERCSPPLYPCNISPTILVTSSICNDNGTANDSSDDFYEISILVTIADPLHTHPYYLDVDGDIFGPFNYGSLAKITVPADGTVHIISATDDFDSYCTVSTQVGPFEPCSTPCTLTPIVTIECFDNGTPNPGDDSYKVIFSATAVVGGLSGKYRVEGNGAAPLKYSYGNSYFLVFVADGDYLDLTFTDDTYEDCFHELTVGPFEPCSEECNLDIDELEWICNDNGSPDPSDDFYVVTMRVSQTGAGSGYDVKVGPDLYGPFEYDSLVTLELPADGSEPFLEVLDSDFSKFCISNKSIGPLDPCSTPCATNISYFGIECFDNNSTDLADDYYELVLVMEPNPNDLDSFYITLNGQTTGPHIYGDSIRWTMPADGMSYSLSIDDKSRPDFCFENIDFGPLDPCSSSCVLEVKSENIICDNNNSGIDPGDDFFTFDLIVSGTDVSSTWIADDPSSTSANYGQRVTMGPYPISAGDIRLTIKDVVDTYCQSFISIPAPEPCSDSCYLDDVRFNIGNCNDNNTGPDKTDDFFFVNISVNGGNLGTTGTFHVDADNNIYGPFDYGGNDDIGPLPANGQDITLTILDSQHDYCSREIVVKQDPCSECTEDADAGPAKTITCASEQVQLEGSASSPGTFEWNGPNSSTYSGEFPIISEAGMYILVVTFDNECVARDTVIVDQDTSLPVAIILPPDTLTCKVDTVILDGSLSSQSPNFEYVWRDGSGTIISNKKSLPIGVTGRFCLQIVDTVLNCRSPQSCVTVSENLSNPDARIFVDPDDLLNCKVDSIRLTAESSINTTYYWEFRNNEFQVDTLWIIDTGMVYLIAEDTLTGCTTIIDLHITALYDYPLISIIPPDTLTCLKESLIIDASNSQKGPDIHVEWLDENGNIIPNTNGYFLNVDDPGTYYLRSTDDKTGCINIDTVVVEERKTFQTANAGPDQTLRCDSDTLTLNGFGSSRGPGISYTWTGINGSIILANANTINPLIEGTGIFTITVIDDYSGCRQVDTVEIDRSDPPIFDIISAQDEICLDQGDGWINIEGLLGGSPPFTYFVNGTQVNESLQEDLIPGRYDIKVIDSKGCKVDTTIYLEQGTSFSTHIVGQINIKEGDTTLLIADVNIPDSEINTIIWESNGVVICQGCKEIRVSPDTSTFYKLTIIDKDGCEAIAQVFVIVKEVNRIFAPNVFTPNGDQNNDVFRVFGKNLVLVRKLIIFDRWGDQVFSGENLNPTEGWDGSFRGELMNPAVFAFYAVGEFKNGQTMKVSGDLTLVK